MSKQYTALRRFYAIIGFTTIIVGLVIGGIKASHFFSKRDTALVEKTYCHVMRDDGTVFAWEC